MMMPSSFALLSHFMVRSELSVEVITRGISMVGKTEAFEFIWLSHGIVSQ